MINSDDAKNVIDTVKKLAEDNVEYKEALSEGGKALTTVGKAVNAALLPVKGLVWGADKIEKFLSEKLSEKFTDVPTVKIQEPDLTIAGPAIENLKFCGHKNILRDMYANLIASSMNLDKSDDAHAAFVDIIKNLSPDEAKILKFLHTKKPQPLIDIYRKSKENEGEIICKRLVNAITKQAGCEKMGAISSYFDNLSRLGLINVDKSRYLTTKGAYDVLENSRNVVQFISEIKASGYEENIFKYFVELTSFGIDFCNSCVE